MSTPHIDPVWGDDWMAIADAVQGALPHPELAAHHLPHPEVREEFTDLALELLVGNWAAEAMADVPIVLVPTDHDTCAGCEEPLCGCVDLCEDLPRDVCSHYGRQYCPACSVRACPDCRSDAERWS